MSEGSRIELLLLSSAFILKGLNTEVDFSLY